MRRFGHRLAELHQISTCKAFGWETDNFIGSLPRSNKQNTDWSDFYVSERLLPQLKLAMDKNHLKKNEIPSEGILLQTCRNLFPETSPSLLHGDLWSGNYLVSADRTPYLIDPATYFGHHEADIAMTRLFGGFGKAFYEAYSEHFPKVGGESERNDIYQLYYLLVHLNLFGGSYKASVKNILGRYF
jgi:fructosamine-3-kinase